jgi:type II secretory pathway component GspD/PulD (secretin)
VALKYARAEEVAAILADLSVNIKVDKGGNRLICYTSPRVIIEIERIIKAIDHPHLQIMLETRLVEVSVDNLEKYGINWSQLSPVETGLFHPGGPVKNGYDADGWQLNPLEMDISLDMLISKGEARVLTNSKLTTTNNREASLHIGDVVPYMVQSYNLTNTGGMNMMIQKEEVGVKLKMTPHINEDREISLTLEPEVSTITGWKGPAADLPLTRVRKTSTTVRVKDNQTIFLAGLLSEEKVNERKRFPILGSIPVLGMLFTHKRVDFKKQNLIIEIKPRIITDWEELNKEMETEMQKKMLDTK